MTYPKEIHVYKGTDDCLHTETPEGDRMQDAKIQYVLKSEVKELVEALEAIATGQTGHAGNCARQALDIWKGL